LERSDEEDEGDPGWCASCEPVQRDEERQQPSLPKHEHHQQRRLPQQQRQARRHHGPKTGAGRDPDRSDDAEPSEVPGEPYRSAAPEQRSQS